MSTETTPKTETKTEAATEPKILTSKEIGGGQDKFRIVGTIGGDSYEVGPYDTKDRAEAEARRLEPLSDKKPEVMVILTCSSVGAILKKFTPKAEAKPATEEKTEESAETKPETAEGAKPEEPKPADPQAAQAPKEAAGRPGVPAQGGQGGQGGKHQAQTRK